MSQLRLVVAIPAMFSLFVAVSATGSRSGVKSIRALSQTSSQLRLVGHSSLDGQELADIWVHGQFAYLGSRPAGGGIKVVDVSDPANPRLISSLISFATSEYEDVMVIRADTAAFHGDLLVAGLQARGSNANSGARGAQFWDVTDPLEPVALGFFDTGSLTGGVHELHLFQRDNHVFALLAVPNSEARNAGGDVRVIDATDPRKPVQIADWGVRARLGLTLNSGIFCH
ncbi:MAG TPA: hypothetical protein VFV34_23535, partial [Blastocatellia bacterium]|nr:hypothetical protein [Blastocatellia bacterium]